MSASRRLEGVGIVVTRPEPAATALAQALVLEGARVWKLPALAIRDLPADAALEATLAGLASFDLAIFVSANAVEKGIAAVRRHGGWPASLQAAAIGEATAQALRNYGIERVISPVERHDSEGLLALAPLQAVRGQNVVVFRGRGGREHLRQALEERGARVAYVECYARVRPDSDVEPVKDALARGEVHAVSALSAETLENFIDMIGSDAARHLAGVTLAVPHVAVGAHPEARRFAHVVVTAHGPAALVDALAPLRVTP